MDKRKRVVVTGMGIVSCFGNDVDAFYEALLAGKSGVRLLSEFPIDDYPTRIGAPVPDFDLEEYMDRKLARRADPFVRFAVVAGKKALEAAALPMHRLDALDKKRCGVIIGSGMGGLSTFYEGTEVLLSKGYRRLSPFFIPFIITNMAGGVLAIDLGFMGPNYSISTACATANYSILAAANHIRMGEADLMVCGGTEAAVSPIGIAGFVANRALSTRNDDPQGACRPWDRSRDGFVIGEGAGVIVLESLEHAEKRGAPILAEFCGGATNCDAYHMTAPREDALGISSCIELALKNAGLRPEEINYVNAHATSTPLGDMAEPLALRNVFGDHIAKMKMNATKSMTGHCLGAAGGVEAVATLKAILTGQLHPTINVRDPDPGIAGIDIVANKAQKFTVNAAISNSFGFGGHNSVLVFAPFKK